MTQPLKFKKLVDDNILPDEFIPRYAHSKDSGMDVYAIEDFILYPGCRHLFRTGFAYKIPDYKYLIEENKKLLEDGIEKVIEIQARPRSGLANKYGVSIVNAPGTLDNGYINEVMINLINLGDEPISIKKIDPLEKDITKNIGTKICQLVLCEVVRSLNTEFTREDFENTDRGSNGHGSTGL